MKTIFFSHTSDLGGGERSLLTLLSSIKNRIDAVVVIPREGPLRVVLASMGIKYYMSEYRWWTVRRSSKRNKIVDTFHEHLTAATGIANIVMHERPDLIVTNTSVICEGALVAYLLKVPHIWHIRELGEKDHGFIYEYGFAFTSKFINDFSSHLVFNSKATLKEFTKYIHLDKTSVVYNAIQLDSNLSQSTVPNIYQRENSFKILVAGTISKKKNQIDALRAVKKLITKGKDVELCLLGNCTDQNLVLYISKYINKHQLQKFVHVHGFIENPYPVFSSTNLVLVTSKNEAFGRTILEAMLLGKPVIATKAGGVPEIIEDGKNGILYTPSNTSELAEKIDTLVNNPSLQKFLADNASISVRDKFSIANYSENLYTLFETEINVPKPRKSLLRILNHQRLK